MSINRGRLVIQPLQAPTTILVVIFWGSNEGPEGIYQGHADSIDSLKHLAINRYLNALTLQILKRIYQNLVQEPDYSKCVYHGVFSGMASQCQLTSS